MRTKLLNPSCLTGIRSRPVLAELLECRIVHSTTTMQAGTLAIDGDANASNRIIVHLVPQSGGAFVFVNNHHSIVPLSRLAAIDVTGGEESDSIIIDGDSSIGTRVAALGGDDSILISTSGNNSIDAGLGDDRVGTGAGSDVIDGGAGDDTINAGDGNDRIDGGSGNDYINGQNGDDIVNGGDGADQVLYDVPTDSFADMSTADSMLLTELAARPATVQPGGQPDPAVPHQGADPIVGWLTVADTSDTGISNSSNPLRISAAFAPLIQQGGWAAYINSQVLPQIAWGCRRFVLWLPFGATQPDPFPYSFDGPLIARELGVNWLLDSFVRDWKSLIDHQAEIGQPIEVIYYQGGIDLSNTIRAEPSLFKRMERLNEASQYPIEAGMTIGLDSDGSAPDGSDAARFAQLLVANGTKVYLESRPRANTWTWNHPIISIDQWWLDSDPDVHPEMRTAGRISTSLLTGEVIRLFTRPDGVPWIPTGWQTSGANGVLSDGYSVSFNVMASIEDHVPRASFDGY